MKKVLLILMSSVLIFACSKNETEKVVENKDLDSNEKKTEQVASENSEKEIISSTSLSPEIHTITVGNDEMGFVYTENFNQEKSNQPCLKLENRISSVLMTTDKIKRGEGEREFADDYFQEMEDAVNKKQELPGNIFSSSARLINIGECKFVEYITLSRFELTEIELTIELRSTTPKNKVWITFKGDSSSLTNSIRTILPMEAPMYFVDSGRTRDYEMKVWGNKIPEWDDSIATTPEYKNMENFCKNLIAGKCESKTAQEIFNQYQQIIKNMKIN